jgi:hypothetical protein
VVRTRIGNFRVLFDVIFNPRNLIDSSSRYTNQSVAERLKTFISVTIFFFLNVIIYALPLSLQGTGFVGDSFSVRLLINNSSSLVSFGFLTYFLYHFGIWVTRRSSGLIPSYRVVMINTSIYLAIIFNLLWIGVFRTETLGRLFNWAFQMLFRTIGYYVGVPPDFDSGLETLPPGSILLSASERAIIVGLIIAFCYYLYVLYIGAKMVHNLTRYESAVAIGFVLTSPVIFAAASLILQQYLSIPSVFTVGY